MLLHPTNKIKELNDAIQQRFNKKIIVYGPSGCGKSHLINSTTNTNNLILNTLSSLSQYKGKFLKKNIIAHFNLNNLNNSEILNLQNIKNIIIETNSLRITKIFKDVIVIKLNKITKNNIKKMNCKNENLHNLKNKSNLKIETRDKDFYRLLGKIFYGKEDALVDLDENDYERVVKYVYQNYGYFLELNEAKELMESISLYDDKDNLISIIKMWKMKKKLPNRFFSFESAPF